MSLLIANSALYVLANSPTPSKLLILAAIRHICENPEAGPHLPPMWHPDAQMYVCDLCYITYRVVNTNQVDIRSIILPK